MNQQQYSFPLYCGGWFMGNLISSYPHVELMYLVLTGILKGIVHPKIRIKHHVLRGGWNFWAGETKALTFQFKSKQCYLCHGFSLNIQLSCYPVMRSHLHMISDNSQQMQPLSKSVILQRTWQDRWISAEETKRKTFSFSNSTLDSFIKRIYKADGSSKDN